MQTAFTRGLGAFGGDDVKVASSNARPGGGCVAHLACAAVRPARLGRRGGPLDIADHREARHQNRIWCFASPLWRCSGWLIRRSPAVPGISTWVRFGAQQYPAHVRAARRLPAVHPDGRPVGDDLVAAFRRLPAGGAPSSRPLSKTGSAVENPMPELSRLVGHVGTRRTWVDHAKIGLRRPGHGAVGLFPASRPCRCSR